MKIVTWNVNSIAARENHVANLLDLVGPDVLCLQELKRTDAEVPTDLFEEMDYWVEVHGQPSYNGVAIAAVAELEDVHRGLPGGDEGQARLIAATCMGVRIVNVYCPQGHAVGSDKYEYKLRFFDRLVQWLGEVASPNDDLVLCGDINIAPDPCDLWDPVAMEGKVSNTPREHEAWRRLLDWGLTDACRPHLPDGTFTFWDYRMNYSRRGIGMRIDHILVTDSLLPRVRGAEVLEALRWEPKPSDHAPLVIDLED